MTQETKAAIQKGAEEYAFKKYGIPKPDGHPLAGDTEDGIRDFIAGRSKSIKEIESLKAWKESATDIINSIDLQQCGKELNLPLGSDISKHILSGIQALKAENERLSGLIEKAFYKGHSYAEGYDQYVKDDWQHFCKENNL